MPHELNISILNTGSITAETGSGIATFEVGSRFLDYGSHIEVVNGQCYDPVMGYVRECPYKDGQSSIKILDNNYATLDNIKMKVTNEGTITAAKQGISAPGTIVNKGTIKSSLAGIRAVQETTRIENYKDIIAATTGISAFGDKELEILNEGTIMAGNFDESVLEDNRANGILANAIKSIINKGQITSKGTGIDMNAISLLNSGTINAQEYGVKFSGTSFTNSGVIDSQTRGVSTVGDFFNTSTGKIYGRNGEGVLASGFVKNEGEIHGGTTGISIGGSSTEFSKLVNMGDIYATNTGLYAKHAIVENYGTITVSEAKGLGISIVDSGKVNFTNEKGGVIGLTSSGIGIRITAFNAEDVINIKNEGSINTTDGTAIKAYDVISAATVSIINNGDIASLKGRGIEGKYLKVKNEEKGFIRGTISGLDVSNTTLENHGNISSVGQDGYETGGFVFVIENVGSSIQTHRYYSGIGVYATSSTVINKGKIEAKNVGIFGKNSIIENYGTITITGSEGAGIVASGGTVYNEGSITFSADNEQEGKVGVEAGYCVTHECYYVSEERAAIISGAPNGGGWYKTRTGSGTTSDPYVYSDFYAKVNRFIVLQDNAKLLTSGTLSSEGTLNLSGFSPDGTGSVSLIKGGQLEAENIVGNLHIDASNVKGGFANDYTVDNAIHALDVSGLRLMSDSVLFTAKLADNGSDVVMTRRSFNDLVANKSLAGFLEMNYAAGNGEGFFNMLKNIGTASEFAGTLSDITAKDTFSRFAYEDLTAMREVNFAMNEAMFANDDKPLFETTGSVNGFGFKSDNNSQSQYALATKRVSPRFKVGYAMSNTTLNSDDDNDTTRRNQLFQVFAPIGYERAGVKLISTPQIGFARGHYTRASDGNGSYKGVIEKRTFALMNEARYPMSFGKYEVAPTVEFNAIAYNQKGREDAKAYALTMPSDTNVSIEGGVGLRLSRAAEVGHDSKLSMTAGVMMYREFADPYNIKMGMQGMEGSFDLYDERSPYRAVASFGFGYDLGSVNMYGSIQHYMQSDTYTKAKAGFKLGF